MIRPWIICILQAALVVAVFSLLRVGRTSATRFAALAAVLVLAPLMLLGSVWPSVHTIAALIALPALCLWLVALVWPAAVRRALVRWYGLAALGLAMGSSVLQASWVVNCHELMLVVPDGFKGTISLVKDSKSGIDLGATGYTVEIPPTAKVRIRDDRFMFRCYTAKVRSASGVELPFEDAGVIAGPDGSPDPQKFSTEFDGTTHQWIVK